LDNGSGVAYTGKGYSGIYLWGAQLDSGAFPTSYIPTVAATVTRNADVANMTGTNFASWYRADEGTIYLEVQSSPNTLSSYLVLFDGNQTRNSIYFDNDSGSMRNVIFSSGSVVSVLGLSSIGTVGTFNKLIATYKTNDFAACRNSGSVVTDTSGNAPSDVSQLILGRNSNNAGSTFISGCIRKIAYYPTRCTNAQLQALTV
jgi:hypothetical protein